MRSVSARSSVRTPASLRPRHSMSLGHLIRAEAARSSRPASQTAAAAGLDDVAARAQRVDALEQLGARHVELVAEDAALDEVVLVLEEQAEDDRVLVHVGPMTVARRGCERTRHS